MSKILPYILTTLIGFAVGIGAGIWTKHITCSIPPPPAAILDELKDASLGSGNPPPTYDAQRDEAYRQIRAEMDEFRQKVSEIKRSLRAQIDPILTPEQRERMGRARERPATTPPPESAPPPLPGRRNFWEGFDAAMSIMMVPFSLERMSDSLDLTPAQKAAVHKLLLERREKFLELVDATPPPSFKILKLAPPEAKTAKPAK
jgi:Spy/CpxP family protein refolding chaperone